MYQRDRESVPNVRMVLAGVAMAFVVAAASNAGPPVDCGPDDTGRRCEPTVCDGAGTTCVPTCIRHDPFSGSNTILACSCSGETSCHAEIAPGSPLGCVVPEDGTGTVHLPPSGCAYISPIGDTMRIVDGLPIGSTVECAPTHHNFLCGLNSVCSFAVPSGPICYAPGGSLGGEKSCANSTLNWQMQGTGAYAAYSRILNIPVDIEIHAAPRTPGNPFQSFNTDMSRMFGQILGDPDFDLLRVVAGTDFGLPSPGHTTLTQLPGSQWAVDSFFDITYRIDFVGKAGGPFSGRSGSTTGTIRISTGGGPRCVSSCFPGFECRQTVTVNPNGTYDVCCECVSIPCEPEPDGSACKLAMCGPFRSCTPRCLTLNPGTDQVFVTDCTCREQGECSAVQIHPGATACVQPNDFTGTVHLPPTACDYRSANYQPMQIIDGLPPFSTIDCMPTHFNFSCAANAVCSFATPIGPICYAPGGSLGGEKSCANSTLNLVMQGTGAMGAFNRNINVPIAFEVHTAPRVLFSAEQGFNTDMFRFFGQITGDPDFDLLRFVAGTDFGLPSPGHTTLTQLPGGNWAVDSFFDVTYRIDFVGRPGGSLSGRSGSTTGVVRLATGGGVACEGMCPPGYTCFKQLTVNPSGTITYCCDCITDCVCRGDMNGDTKLNGKDIQQFVDCWVNYFGGYIDAPCVCADMDSDGVLSDTDVNLFATKLLTDPDNLCP
ncbi:MAG: hypothetical protein HZA51_07245 [Planctomycetes bacterium]|nr:hypothetical protein [Planctomycetota bacterium]